MKKHLEVLIYITAAAGLILIVVACSPLFSTPETVPTSVLTEPPVTTLEPIVYAPEAGTRVAWVDMSYVVYVPPGDFQMGQDETEPSDHSPAHTVYLDGFWIHQTEVTNRMYALCVAVGICTVPYQETGMPYWYTNSAHADAPVVGVDWYQAQTYCEWIEARLPTEAEWEKAARGTEGDPYPWGVEDPDCNLLNFAGCFEPVSPVDVRSYFDGASPYELADTAGNASEWVFDWYDEEYYAVSSLQNPTGPADGELRVVRGSNFASEADAVPIYLRLAVDPLEHHAEVGFRCVLTGEAVGEPPPSVCEMPAYSPGAVDTGHTLEPIPPSFTAYPYCLPDQAGASHGYVNLVFGGPVETDTYIITSTAGPVTVDQDSSHPDTLILSGAGIPVEQSFDLTICPAMVAPPPPPEEPLCPANYVFDPITGKCRYISPTPGDPCDSEHEIWLAGYGCVPVLYDPLIVDPFWCDVMIGHQAVKIAESPETWVCLPIDGPEDCEDNPDCSTNTNCLPGLTYIPDDDCCAYVPEVDPVCLAGYTYNPTLMLCIPKKPSYQCTTISIYIPACETPQQNVCQNPGQYLDQASCEAAYCRWVIRYVAPSYCTYP